MGACSGTLNKVAPEPNSKAAGYAKGAEGKKQTKPKLTRIHGSDAKQFPEVFSAVEIDSKHDRLILTFSTKVAAANFFQIVNWKNKDKAIVLEDTKLAVKMRTPNLTYFSQPSAYKAVINAIVSNTAYKDCQDFINAIQDPSDAKDSNQRILAVLNIVGIWSQRIRALRLDGVKSYAQKRPNFKLKLNDILQSYVEIIKTDQNLCNAWSKLSFEGIKFVPSLGEQAIAFLLKHA